MSRKVFGSYQEAYDWLNETDSGWYDNRAVVYIEKEAKSLPSRTKKQEMIGKRLQEARQKYTELSSTPHFAKVKSALITCKACGSKIASGYMRNRNDCPVCKASMLPPTDQNRLQKCLETVKTLEKEYKAEEASYQKKLSEANKKSYKKEDLRWLVYYDYHT